MTASEKLSSRNQPVPEPAIVVDLGHGRWMVDRGTHAGHEAIFFEPAPEPGPFMERAPHLAPIDVVQPGTVCLRFERPEAVTFLRWYLATIDDPARTPADPHEYAARVRPNVAAPSDAGVVDVERLIARLEYHVNAKATRASGPDRDAWIDAVEACDQARRDLLTHVAALRQGEAR